MKHACGLEESELRAVLISPRAARVLTVDRDVVDFGARTRVVAGRGVSILNAALNQSVEDFSGGQVLERDQSLTETLGGSILDFTSWEIAEVSHEIISPHVFSSCANQELVNSVFLSIVTEDTLFGGVDVSANESIGTVLPDVLGAQVNLLIVGPHVFPRLDHGGGSPAGNSPLRVLVTEPSGEGAGVAAADHYGLARGHILVHDRQEVGEVSEALF